MTPHLIAHVVNATTEPAIELEIATKADGEWFTNDGHQVWPFWVSELAPLDIPTNFPADWLTHLAAEADRMAARASYHKSIGLLSAIGLSAPKAAPTPAPIKRRI